MAGSEKSPGKTAGSNALDKANSLLDEMTREDRYGFKAEIDGLKGKVDKIANDTSYDKSLGKGSTGSKNKDVDEPVKRTTS